MRRRSLLQGLAGVGFLAATDRRAFAQKREADYPVRPVRVILPFTPGGAIDQMARIAAQMLTDNLKQSFVVESRPGAGGVTGTTSVINSPADGYTLLAASASAITIAPYLMPRMPYDPEKDLLPIVRLGDSPMAVVVRHESRFRTLQELIDAAKSKPNGLNYGSAGYGSAAHLAGELFKWRAGVEIRHVPYKGVGPAQIDLLSGVLDVMFVNYSVVHSTVQSGKLRVLAMATEQRIATLKDYPTAAELGVSGYVAGNWNGLMAPAGTSREIIARLNTIVVEGFRDKTLIGRMTEMGMDPVTGSPDEFAAHIRRETNQMKALLSSVKIQTE